MFQGSPGLKGIPTRTEGRTKSACLRCAGPCPTYPSKALCLSPRTPQWLLSYLASFQGHPTKCTQGSTLHCSERSRRLCRGCLPGFSHIVPACMGAASLAKTHANPRRKPESRSLFFFSRKRQGLVILPRLPLGSWAYVSILPWPPQQLGP